MKIDAISCRNASLSPGFSDRRFSIDCGSMTAVSVMKSLKDRFSPNRLGLQYRSKAGRCARRYSKEFHGLDSDRRPFEGRVLLDLLDRGEPKQNFFQAVVAQWSVAHLGRLLGDFLHAPRIRNQSTQLFGHEHEFVKRDSSL